jgi:ribosome maturation factor RimP
MSENNIAQTITELAAPLAASLGLDIWDVDAAFGKRGLVRVFVENEDSVNIDKCAELSRLLGLTLDVEDVLPGAYVLEVSSPGLERTFFSGEQLAKYLGKNVDVTLHAPVASHYDRRRFLGELVKAKNGEFTVMPLDLPKNDPNPTSFTWEDVNPPPAEAGGFE